MVTFLRGVLVHSADSRKERAAGDNSHSPAAGKEYHNYIPVCAYTGIGDEPMPKLQVFDPAMCCSTGVCGPSVDPALPRFAADLEWLKSKGIEIERHNLAQEVAAFTSNLVVKSALNSKGSKCLPLLLLDGKIVGEGVYPTRGQLASIAHVEFEPGPVITQVKEKQPFVTIGAAGKPGGS
jgi:hypothetical protein